MIVARGLGIGAVTGAIVAFGLGISGSSPTPPETPAQVPSLVYGGLGNHHAKLPSVRKPAVDSRLARIPRGMSVTEFRDRQRREIAAVVAVFLNLEDP